MDFAPLREVQRKGMIKNNIKNNYYRQRTMKFSQGLGVILGTTTLALVQYQSVSALTAVEVNDIAKPITVMIGGLDGKGSGVIIAKNGNTYTVLTANHVVKKAGYGLYEIITYDGQKYQMENKAQILGKLDLALVRFTSSKNYPLAKIADSRTVKQGATVYISGFPIPSETNNQQRIHFFISSQITAKGNGENLGYDLFFNGNPRPGISGGPILNDQGEVIGIYGKAEFGRSESALARDGVQGIPTEKFPNLISNIQNNIQNNTQANTPRNNPSPTNEPTPVIFQNLEALLKAGKWRDADLETWELMLKLTKREQEGWLRVKDVKNFPRQELRKMDQLWVKYSNGKFGFSVQKQIWLELGGKLDGEPDYITDYDTYVKLSERVGWRKNDAWLSYDSYTFSTNALPGHLPGFGEVVVGVVVVSEVYYSFLFSRL
ncbi:GUN4 domain-containing protein, partial [Dolichospermum circinale CS-537/05]|nr:GUN4 domain-containing protein [Dolichospermum circinale CS-537/05]